MLFWNFGLFRVFFGTRRFYNIIFKDLIYFSFVLQRLSSLPRFVKIILDPKDFSRTFWSTWTFRIIFQGPSLVLKVGFFFKIFCITFFNDYYFQKNSQDFYVFFFWLFFQNPFGKLRFPKIIFQWRKFSNIPSLPRFQVLRLFFIEV